MNDAVTTPTSFELGHKAEAVYLLISNDRGHRILFTSMEPAGENTWRQTIPLRSGTYRVRYYIDDGQSVILHVPAQKGVPARGHDFDLVIQIPQPEASDTSPTVPARAFYTGCRRHGGKVQRCEPAPRRSRIEASYPSN